jgi:hypothetical protein
MATYQMTDNQGRVIAKGSIEEVKAQAEKCISHPTT